MLVEAAWAAAKARGPLRSFFLRIRARRGMQIAVVATARKLATIVWHVLTDQEDFTWARPSLVAMKERRLQLQAGAARMRPAGPKGTRRCLQCESAARSRTQGRGERRAHLQSLCGALAAAEAESQDGSAAVEMTASSGLSISSVEPSRLFIHCPAQTKLQSDRLRVRRETIGKVSILNILDRTTQSIFNIAHERAHMRSLCHWKRGSASL